MFKLLFQAFLCLAATAVSAVSTVSAQSFRLAGEVLDAADRNPIPGATVLLLTPDSTLLQGEAADPAGRFAFDAARPGQRLACSCIGYESRCITLSAAGEPLQILLDASAEALDEVVVRAAARTFRPDRQVLLPTDEERRTATDGRDLLRKIDLPRIAIHPLTGQIATTSNGTVRLCIDGVQVTSAEVAALDPEEILRIEYHDTPSARYADAEAVIDLITRRREQGGSIGAELCNYLGNGWISLDALSLKRYAGRSAWSFETEYFGLRRDEWTRDYDELRLLPDATIRRQQTGEPVPAEEHTLCNTLNYSFVDADRQQFNLRLACTWEHAPHSEAGERSNRLLSETGEQLRIEERLSERSLSPTLDLYYRRRLSDAGTLFFDAVGTWIRSESRHSYLEQEASGEAQLLRSTIRGDRRSAIVEGLYEHRFGRQRLTAGLRHLQSYTANRYSGTQSASVALHQAESALYASWQGSWRRWSWTTDLTAARLRYRQGAQRTEHSSLRPAATLAFAPDERWQLRYRIDVRSTAPSLAAMNDAEQWIDTETVRRGNPALRPFRTIEQRLTASGSGPRIGFDLSLERHDERHPVMESVRCEEGLFVRIDENQRSFCRLGLEATLTLRLWQEHLTLSATPILRRYDSRGNDYRHRRTTAEWRWAADLHWGDWSIAYQTMPAYVNRMYGETLYEENNMQLLSAGLRRKRWSVEAGLLNPFLKRYRMEQRDLSAVNPSLMRAHTAKCRSAMLRLSLRLDYGSRRSEGASQRLRNADTERGIMQGIK